MDGNGVELPRILFRQPCFVLLNKYGLQKFEPDDPAALECRSALEQNEGRIFV